MTFLATLFDVLVELAPWLLLGALVAGLLHVALPSDFVRRSLRGRGGVLKAALLGVPLPLCSCGVIPAGLGLKKDGASNGAAVGFLISTPQTGVDSILVSASFLGWPFALFKVLSAFALGLIGGVITDAVDPGVEEAPEPDAKAKARTWGDGLEHAIDMIRTIWRWLVFGVVVSALITTFAPHGAFEGLAAYGGAAAMAAMLAISLPLYVCATASVPIAAALVAGGFPPGAALVFLMAGPATNIATVGAVKAAFGTRTLVVYILTIALGSVLLGSAFDFLLVGELGLSAGPVAHHDANPVALVATAILVALFTFFAFEELRAFVRSRRPAREDTGREDTVELGVEGLTCGGCVRKLETQLRALPAVGEVAVSLEEGTARVAGADEDAVAEAIRAAGFTPHAKDRIELQVEGLTCDGCVRKLERALSEADGVTEVHVGREPGRAVVRGSIERDVVAGLIRDAGFEPS